MKPTCISLCLTLGLLLAGCEQRQVSLVPPTAAWTVELAPFELENVVLPNIDALRLELASSPSEDWESADPERVLGLVSLLAGRDGRMRAAAQEEARGLARRCDAQLATLIEDSSAEQSIRSSAVELLALVGGERAAELLLGYLEGSKESWLRTHAAWRLGELQMDWVIPRMVLRLRYEEDFQTVIWIAKSLGLLGNFQGLSALQAVADATQDEALISSAYERMDEIASAAEYADVMSLWNSWYAGPVFPAIPKGLPAQRSKRYRLEVWTLIYRFVEFQLRGVDDARFVLQRLDPIAVEIMAEALRDHNAYIRVGVAQSLQRMGPRASPAGKLLMHGLADPDLGPHAAEALGAIGADGFGAGQAALVQCLASNQNPELRLAAIRALAGFGSQPDPGAVALLRATFEAKPIAAAQVPTRIETEEFRQAAAESLLALGEAAGVIEALLDWMTSKTVSPSSSQLALRQWLAGLEQTPDAAALIEAWDALTPPAQKLLSEQQREALKRAQADLLRARLPELLAANSTHESAAESP